MTSQPIIVNTHGDGDHVGGNPVLSDGAVVVAHPGVRRQMVRYFALPILNAAGQPSVTVTEFTTIHFNNDIIRLLPVPGGHTAGDMVAQFTKAKIACVGDLVLLGTFPNADPGRGCDAQRLIEVLTEIHETLPSDTTLVASHGGAFMMKASSFELIFRLHNPKPGKTRTHAIRKFSISVTLGVLAT